MVFDGFAQIDEKGDRQKQETAIKAAAATAFIGNLSLMCVLALYSIFCESRRSWF